MKFDSLLSITILQFREKYTGGTAIWKNVDISRLVNDTENPIATDSMVLIREDVAKIFKPAYEKIYSSYEFRIVKIKELE